MVVYSDVIISEAAIITTPLIIGTLPFIGFPRPVYKIRESPGSGQALVIFQFVNMHSVLQIEVPPS